MALTLRRFALAGAVCCGLVWVGLFYQRRARAANERAAAGAVSVTPEAKRLGLVSNTLAKTNDRLRLLEIRDSVLAIYEKHPAGGLRILADSTLPAAVTGSMSNLIRARWQQLHIAASVPVVVVFVLDSATNPHALPRRYGAAFVNPIDVFLPRGEGTPCMSVVRMNTPFSKMTPHVRAIVQQNLEAPETVSAVLGPCAYLAAFGQPGPFVEQWLRDSGWSLARLAAWDQAAPPWIPRGGAGYYYFRDQLATIGDPFWQTRLVVGLPGLACIAGERGVCANAALATRSATTDTTWRNAVVSTHGASSAFFYVPVKPSPLGAGDSWLVSEMARSLGKDAFARFWSSTKPVPDAFADASGESLDSWIHAWARRTYGNVPAGPSLSVSGLLAGTAALIAGLALAVALERRRRVA